MPKSRAKLLLETHSPKNVHVYVKKDAELLDAINKCHGVTISERMYNFIHAPGLICPNGNSYKFKSSVDGYGFCGPAAKCQCTRQSVSNNVSKSKKANTLEQKMATNAKRDATNLEKYGVANIGQTVAARAAHRACYDDPERVEEIVARVKSTKFEKYGNENYINIEKGKETRRANMTPEYWADKLQNPKYIILHDAEAFLELLNEYSVSMIAEKLKVSKQTIRRYQKAINAKFDPDESII